MSCELGRTNLIRPSALSGPGLWRSRAVPAASASMLSAVTGKGSVRARAASSPRSCARASLSPRLGAGTTARNASMQQDLAQNDGLIVRLVVRGIDEGQRTLPRHIAQSAEQRALPRELVPVTAAELLPALRIVSEPLAQLVARRDVLHPLRDGCIRLLYAPGPKPIDENPRAVAGRGRVVHAFDPDFGTGFGAAHRDLLGCALRAHRLRLRRPASSPTPEVQSRPGAARMRIDAGALTRRVAALRAAHEAATATTYSLRSAAGPRFLGSCRMAERRRKR